MLQTRSLYSSYFSWPPCSLCPIMLKYPWPSWTGREEGYQRQTSCRRCPCGHCNWRNHRQPGWRRGRCWWHLLVWLKSLCSSADNTSIGGNGCSVNTVKATEASVTRPYALLDTGSLQPMDEQLDPVSKLRRPQGLPPNNQHPFSKHCRDFLSPESRMPRHVELGTMLPGTALY
jgi:hypothetical protein